MKIKEDFILRKVNDIGVVVPVGKTARSFQGMITLNDTGSFLWELLQNENDTEGLAAALIESYEVDADTALRDVNDFLNKMREAGVLEE